MTIPQTLRPSRRSFLAGSTAAASGLVLGFHIPFGTAAHAQSTGAPASPEVNAWVVVRPDDTVVIRIARSEMGQGTLTGLAQMESKPAKAAPKRAPLSSQRGRKLRAMHAGVHQ